jgi:hypothetical protein
VLNVTGTAFNHDAMEFNGEVWIAWSSTQGEAPGDLVKFALDRTSPRRPLVPQTVWPVYSFTHPVNVHPFKAEGSGCADIFTIGTYTEAVVPPLPPPSGTRVLLAHDGEQDWTIPVGLLRPFDIAMWELYLIPQETTLQSAQRWMRQAQWYLSQWSGDCGVIPMFYDQLRWTPQQILDGLAHLSDIVNLSPRIKEIAPFAYDRANYNRVSQTSRRQRLAPAPPC